jgi:cytochrome c553
MRTAPRRASALIAAAVALAAPASAQEVNIEEIFWCNEGEPTGEQTPEQCLASRDAVLTNCTSCHTFVPIVKSQKTPEQWNAMLQAHRENVSSMSDEDYQQLEAFLAAHFNPENEPPTLPPALEALGTNQAF